MRSVMTGATGFIGRNLLALLLERDEQVFAIVRPSSAERLPRSATGSASTTAARRRSTATCTRRASACVTRTSSASPAPSTSSTSRPCTTSRPTPPRPARRTSTAPVTRSSSRRPPSRLLPPHQLDRGCAGRYDGVFTEEMLDEAVGLDHPYFATKHESERLVRETCPVPWHVYRPSIVVGRSDNGEMDKVDGPYYFFPYLKRLATLPQPGADRDAVRRARERRAGRLRRRRDRPHRAPRRPRRPGVPHRRPRPRFGRRRARHVLPRGGRTALRQHPAAGARRVARDRQPLARADGRRRCSDSDSPRRSRTISGGRRASTRPTPTPRSRAATSRCRRSTRTRTRCGTSGAAASTAATRSGALGRAVSGRTVMITGASSGIGRDHRARRSQRPAASRCSSRAASRRSRRRRPRSCGPVEPRSCTAPTSPTSRTASAWPRRCSRRTAASTCSSTTRADRSGVRWRRQPTGSTTSSARCSSTTSARSR